MATRMLPWIAEVRLDGPGPDRLMLIAGFGSSLEVLRDLGEAYHARRAATVLLTGLPRHTGDPQQFLRSRGWQYLREAEHRFLRFWDETRTAVWLGGYSTGALLAVLLAARHPEKVAGLVMLSPAFRLAKTAKQLAGYGVGSLYYGVLPAAMLGTVLGLAWHSRRKGWERGGTGLRVLGSIAVFSTAALGLRNLTMPLNPGQPVLRDGELVLAPHFLRASVVAGSTLMPLQHAARRALQRLTMPIAAIFGALDDVVDVPFGSRLTGRLPCAETYVLHGAPHRVVAEPRCHDIVVAFVERTPR